MIPITIANQRRFPRLQAVIPIRLLTPLENYQLEQEAVMEDWSRRGARIRTAAALSCGQVVVVLSLVSSRSFTPARVVWARGAGLGVEGVAGLEFLKSLPM